MTMDVRHVNVCQNPFVVMELNLWPVFKIHALQIVAPKLPHVLPIIVVDAKHTITIPLENLSNIVARNVIL